MDKILNKRQIRSILINLICVKLLFMYPRGLTQNSGSAAWIQVIYVSLIALILFSVSMKLYEKIGLKSVLALGEELGGKPLKIIVGVFSAWIFSLCIATTVRSFPEVIKMVLLPVTPIEIILLVFGAAIVIGSRCGLVSLAKIHEIFLPVAAVIVLLFLGFLMPEINLDYIFPILGTGVKNIFLSGINALDIFGDIFALNFLFSYCKSFEDAKTAGYQAILVSSAFAIVSSFLFAATYAYPVSENFLFPFYQMARLIQIGEFFQRMEAFFEFMWSISILLYSSFYLYLICNILRETFFLQYHEPLLIPVLSIIMSVSFLAGDMREMLSNYSWVGDVIYMTAFFLPILLELCYLKKRGESD